MELVAYHNDAKLKEALVREITKHEKADQILQGTYGGELNGDWKGCAVACSLRSLAIINKEKLVERYSNHALYTDLFGKGGETIGRLEDCLFEGMTKKDAKTFPRKFAEAIPVGADLSFVPAKFMVFILKDTLKHKGVRDNKEVVKVVKDVVKLWQDVIEGKYVGKDKDLASAARSAESAAWSAARSAESAAWSAAWSAESAAWSAARSAAWSARSAAESAESADPKAVMEEAVAWARVFA